MAAIDRWVACRKGSPITFADERTSPAPEQRLVDEENSLLRVLAMGDQQRKAAYRLTVERLKVVGLVVDRTGSNWTDRPVTWTHYFRLLIVEADQAIRAAQEVRREQ